MKYRKFGSLDWNVSALGFGCMRLPTADGVPGSGNIDEAEAIRMIRHAIDQGVNYVDTAYPYHGMNSEIVVGKALRDGYRDKVKLATKCPVWLINSPDDFDKYLDEQLSKLQTDHIDFYLLHALGRDRWNNMVLKYDLLNKAEAAKKAGKIRHLGFSFHDEPGAFKEIVDGYDKWEFCQIQYNFMDTENQAGIAGLKYAASKGLAVVIMEPLLGGKLANPPKSILELYSSFAKKRSAADWALQWIWNQPEVSVVLSGMSSMDQVRENLRSADDSGINTLCPEEVGLIESVRKKYKERLAIPCTGCNYCMPCPNGVDIPSNFELYNNGFVHENMEASRFTYSKFFKAEEKADVCIQCRICETKCPQKISISEWLPKVHLALK